MTKKICNTLLGLHNSSHPTQTYSIIANSSSTSQVLITLLWCFSSDSSFFFSRFTSRCKVSTWAPSLVRASNSDLSRLFCKVLKHWIEYWTDHFEHSSWIKKRTIYWVIKGSLGLGQTLTFSWDEPNSNMGRPKLRSSFRSHVERRSRGTNQLNQIRDKFCPQRG